jgi:hypothetical protein
MILNCDRCTCGMGCGLQWPLQVFHTELQAWEPKLLEGETWAGGGEFKNPASHSVSNTAHPQQLNQLPSLPKQNTSTLDPFLYITSHLTSRST